MIEKNSDFVIERGDIFGVELALENGRKIKQAVIVIQNDIGNRYCDSVIAAPVIPELKVKGAQLGVIIEAGPETGLSTDHLALFTQIRTLEKHFFKRGFYLGRPSQKAMERIDEAIKLSLGISTLQRLQTRKRLTDSALQKRKSDL